MFAIERIRIIKNCLVKEHKVSVAKLSDLLNVTEVTIRRDLEKLEREGFLKRTHGGAVLTTGDEDFFPADLSYPEDAQLYQEIADTAFHMVEDGSSVMLTSGPVNLMIAKALCGRNNLTLITNDLHIASLHSHAATNNVICLGGDLEEHALYGQMTSDNLRNFSFDHLFAEIDGFSEGTGMSVSSMKRATLLQQAVRLAERITIVCPSECFGQKSLYRIGQPSASYRILTDSNLDDHYKKILFDQKLPVYTSIDVYED